MKLHSNYIRMFIILLRSVMSLYDVVDWKSKVFKFLHLGQCCASITIATIQSFSSKKYNAHSGGPFSIASS